MTSWRTDPALASRFHRDFPDDLQVIVHDGEPRRTGKQPELCWARITGERARAQFPRGPHDAPTYHDTAVYIATLLNQPHELTTIRGGERIFLVVAEGLPHPLMVTRDYLTERAVWSVVPCNRCGAEHTLDPPTTMAETRFPGTEAGTRPIAFSAFCPCGGTMMLSLIAAR
jgi:hypothetical protein